MSKVTGNWTTIFARKITGRNGEIVGFASRGVEPSHFEDFVASLALNGDTVISMIHRDGTIIARYPQDAGVVGRNIIDQPVFRKVIEPGRQHVRPLLEPVGRGQCRGGAVARAFSDPDPRRRPEPRPRWRTGGRRPSCSSAPQCSRFSSSS